MSAQRGVVLVVVAFLACLNSLCDAKLATGSLQLDSMNTEQYLAKFSFSVGQGYIEGNFSSQKSYFDHRRHDLRIYLFSDVGFAKYRSLVNKGSLCRERMAEASWSTKIAPDRSSEDQFFSFVTEVSVVGRTHYWYAMVADCWLEEYDAHPPKFEYKLLFLDRNHSHLPADQRGLLTLHLVLLVGMVAGALFGAKLLLAQYQQTKQLHLVTVLFTIAYLSQLLSVLCEFVHLFRYSQDGLGFRWPVTLLPLDQASSVFQSLSEIMISVLLLCIAFGWTLQDSLSPQGSQPPPTTFLDRALLTLRSPKLIFSRLGPASFVVPLVGIVMVILELMGHSYDDEFNQFHDFEHLPGFVLVGLRFALGMIFTRGIYQSIQASMHVELTGFYQKLRLAGNTWFLSFPVLVFCTFLFPPYVRHQIITAGSLTLQITALTVMAYEFLTASDYYKLSSLSTVGINSLAPVTKGKSKIAMD